MSVYDPHHRKYINQLLMVQRNAALCTLYRYHKIRSEQKCFEICNDGHCQKKSLLINYKIQHSLIAIPLSCRVSTILYHGNLSAEVQTIIATLLLHSTVQKWGMRGFPSLLQNIRGGIPCPARIPSKPACLCSGILWRRTKLMITNPLSCAKD